MIKDNLSYYTPTHYLLNVTVKLAKQAAKKYAETRDLWIESLQTEEDKQQKNFTLKHPKSGVEIHHTSAERYPNSDEYKPRYIQWKDEYEEKFQETSDLFNNSYKEIDDMTEEFMLVGIKIIEKIQSSAQATATAYLLIPESVRADDVLMKEVFENDEEIHSYIKEYSQTILPPEGKEIIDWFNTEKSEQVDTLNKYFGLSILMSF